MNDLERLLKNASREQGLTGRPVAGRHRLAGPLAFQGASFGEEDEFRAGSNPSPPAPLPQGARGEKSGDVDGGAAGADPAQFLRLFLENERRIYAFIVSILPNLSDAEDVLQETSLILWQKFSQFEIGTDFVAWACRVAQLRVMKFYEKRGRSKLQFDAAALEAVANEAIGMAPLLEDRHHALAKCLEALSARDRDLLQRRYADDASPQQIAGQVGRSIHAIYKALSRIHDGLMECVRRRMSKEWNG
jgi:RNA polymerase sigma-70 factor, ECF subfamily